MNASARLLWTLALAFVSPSTLGAADDTAYFEELGSDSGFAFRYESGRTDQQYLPEIMGGGAALLDADGDGDLDIYLTQGGRLGSEALGGPPGDVLFRNALEGGALSFVEATADFGIRANGYGMGVTSADFNNDGRADLYVANLGPNQLWMSREDGTFVLADGARGDSWSVSASAFDADRDGDLDLYVVNYVDFKFYRHRRCPTDSGRLDYCGPLNFPGRGDRFYRNSGDGTFVDATREVGLEAPQSRGLGVVAADLNDDDWIDLFVANDQMANHLWLNQNGKRFVDEGLFSGVALNARGDPEASMGVALGDYDADSDLDLFVTHLKGETNTLYRNDGGGVFEDVTDVVGLGAPSWPTTGFGTAWIDVDGDGWLDVIALNGEIKTIEERARDGDPFPLRQSNQLYLNRSAPASGSRKFELATGAAAAVFAPLEVSRGLAIGDLDNDGDDDLVEVNIDAPSRILLNRGADASQWIGVELRGSDSPHQGIGAELRIEVQGRVSLRRIATDGSYASSRDVRRAISLGASAPSNVDILVEWPSGRRESFEVATGRYTLLTEGTGRNPAAQSRSQ